MEPFQKCQRNGTPPNEIQIWAAMNTKIKKFILLEDIKTFQGKFLTEVIITYFHIKGSVYKTKNWILDINDDGKIYQFKV